MKIKFFLCMAIIALLTAAPKGSGTAASAFAGEDKAEPGERIGSEADPPPEPLAGSGPRPRHDRLMRDLDREYQRGGLTKTEYIQRKRLIETEEE